LRARERGGGGDRSGYFGSDLRTHLLGAGSGGTRLVFHPPARLNFQAL
jgi:hypothetical protein